MKIRAIYVFILLLFLINCTKSKLQQNRLETLEANRNSCTVTYVDGKAYIVDENDNVVANIKSGMDLTENSLIKTDVNSYLELTIGENSIVRIKENTKIKLITLLKINEKTDTDIKLEVGSIFANPEKLTSGSTFKITTRSITAGVRGTEFIVVSTEKGDVTVAVKKGEVFVKANIPAELIKELESKDKDLAQKVERCIESEIVLKENEKVEVLSNLYEKHKEKILSTTLFDEKNITLLREDSKKLLVKKSLTEKDWDNLNIKDIKNIKEQNKVEVEKKDKEQMKNQEIKQEIKEEKKITYKSILVDVPLQGNFSFSEKSTAIASTKNSLVIANDIDNTIYSINPENGELLWKFRHENLTKIQSIPVFFRGNIVFATFTDIFIINESGKVVLSKSITNGPSFWATPVILKNRVFIPTARKIYYYDGRTIDAFSESELPVASSQLYISTDQNKTLFLVDSLSKIAKAFDVENRKVIWETNALKDIVFCKPIFYNGNLVIVDIAGNVYKFDIANLKTDPCLININVGITSEPVIHNNNLYLLAKDGCLYAINLETFNSFVKIAEIDKNPEQNKYLVKKLVKNKNGIYFPSDRGSVFAYYFDKNYYEFISGEKIKSPLISTVIFIDDNLYVFDSDGKLYQKKEAVE